MSENAIVVFDATQAIAQVKHRATIVNELRSQIMVKGKDYGVIPGTRGKATLLKPGAERLCSAFGMRPSFDVVSKQEVWSVDDALFHYEYKCILTHIESGKVLADANGSCNSMESKYRWRWFWPNEVPDYVDKETLEYRTTRKGGKQYRMANDDIFSQVNTISKMAQKRALVAAVLLATNASEHFTQDIEDLPNFGVIEADFEEVKPKEPAITKEKLERLYERVRTSDALDGTETLNDADIFGLLCEEGSKEPFDLEWWNTHYKSINAAAGEIMEIWVMLHPVEEEATESALTGLDPNFDKANPLMNFGKEEAPDHYDESEIPN